jgi:DNA-binding transcriptional ArsR family regulator
MLNKDQTPLTDLFAALGDPVRFGIVERLLCEGEVAAGDLSAGFNVSAPAISRHLSVLRNAGIVHRRVDRQRRLYSVEPKAIRAAAAWVMSHREFWEGSLSRLDALMALEEKRHDR